MNTLQPAIDLFDSQAALAKAVGVTPMVLHNWKKRGIPAERCWSIERATNGRVTCHDLRPDVFPPTGERRATA